MSFWLELGGAYLGGLATAALLVVAGALVMRRRMQRSISVSMIDPAMIRDLEAELLNGLGEDVLGEGDDDAAEHGA